MTFRIIRPVAIADANLISSNIAENDYQAFSLAPTYALGERVMLVATNVHSIYQSVVAGNSGHDPLLDSLSTPLYWSRVGSTKRWTMFDQSITSQSTNPSSISVTLNVPSRVDSVSLMNCDAATLNIQQTDVNDGLVYNKDYSLVSTAGISDWWHYFFEPIVRIKDFSVSDLFPYNSPSIQITLSAPGNVGVGECVLGLSADMGNIFYGASVGIQDYSIKTQDIYGNYSIKKRAFNKIADWQLLVPNTKVDQLQKVLADYRATPIVYVGSELYASTIIYGFYSDFKITIAYPTQSLCTMSLKGLT